MRGQDRQSRVFYELCALVLNILRSPPLPIQSSSSSSGDVIMGGSSRRGGLQVTPAGFASLLLGISLALMLCGSVTFVIGMLLMPWVLGLVMVFYFVGVVSNLSGLGRSILCPAGTGDDGSGKEIAGPPALERCFGQARCDVCQREINNPNNLMVGD